MRGGHSEEGLLRFFPFARMRGRAACVALSVISFEAQTNDCLKDGRNDKCDAQRILEDRFGYGSHNGNFAWTSGVGCGGGIFGARMGERRRNEAYAACSAGMEG
jgi:hypothetical protein